VRSDGIVLETPVLDQDLGLLRSVKNPTMKQLASKFAVEALIVDVLPQTSWLDQ